MTTQFRLLMGSFFAILAVLMLMYIYNMPTPWLDGFMDMRGRCGPNLGVCPEGLRCLNGYCKSDIAPKLPVLSDLPVRPDRYPYEVNPPPRNIVGVCDGDL